MHPTVISSMCGEWLKDFRREEYYKLANRLLNAEGTDLVDVCVCNHGRHRSVAFSCFKKWILESQGVTTTMSHLPSSALNDAACGWCDECNLDNPALEECREFILREFEETLASR